MTKSEEKKTKTTPKFRGTGEPERRSQRRAKVLVPIDFGPNARAVIDFAMQYAQNVPSELYLFHVFESVNRRSKVGKELYDRLDTDLKRLENMATLELERLATDEDERQRLMNFHTRVANGRPWEEILRMASNIGADVIVMGHHSDGSPENATAGSQTERVVRKAPCTTICVRPKDPYFVMP